MFGGWNTNTNGTGTNYTADSNYTPTADITLYAKWDTAVFNTIAEFSTWLASQPANTSTTSPYTVKLDVSDLGGSYRDSQSLGKLLSAHNDKFVNLDLSGSTIPNTYTNASGNTIEVLFEAFGAGDNPSSTTGSCLNLVGITIPAHITKSGYDAFFQCSNLTSVIMPGVTEISAGCFTNCTKLNNVTIPAGVTIIGSNAFVGCTGLTKVIFATGSNISNGNIPSSGSPYFDNSAFIGDLRSAYFGTNGGPGTYERSGSTWTK
jgi:hypothetical protein